MISTRSWCWSFQNRTLDLNLQAAHHRGNHTAAECCASEPHESSRFTPCSNFPGSCRAPCGGFAPSAPRRLPLHPSTGGSCSSVIACFHFVSKAWNLHQTQGVSSCSRGLVICSSCAQSGFASYLGKPPVNRAGYTHKIREHVVLLPSFKG